MNEYIEHAVGNEHAIRLSRALSGMHIKKVIFRRALEACLSHLDVIYRDFDEKNLGVPGMCQLSAAIWNDIGFDEKMSLLCYLTAMQGFQDELDRSTIMKAIAGGRQNVHNIA